MPTSPAWGARLLYAFFVAQTDRDGRAVPGEVRGLSFVDLFERLKATLGGMTSIKTVEAVGETTEWRTEPTTVVLVLAEQALEAAADVIITEEAGRLQSGLLQDEVWVTKQALQLYIAREAREAGL